MARANKRLPSSVNVSKSAIDSATSTLQGLPEKPKENWSLREAVSVLQESISAALSKGYSYEEVAKMLTAKGVDISASSLKSYLSAAKRQGVPAMAKKRGGRRKKGEDTDANMNGVSNHADPTLTSTKAALSALSEPDASTVIGDTEMELPAKSPTRRKSKAEATPTTRKTAAKSKAAAKTTSAVSKTKATPRTPSSRARKKSS